MLTLERVRRDIGAFPALGRIGLGLMAIGLLADVVAHLGPPVDVVLVAHHVAEQHAAHLTGFVGMVLVLLGVVVDGVQRIRPGRRSA